MGQESVCGTQTHISSTLFKQFQIRYVLKIHLTMLYKLTIALGGFSEYLIAEDQSKFLVKMGCIGTIAGQMGQFVGQLGQMCPNVDTAGLNGTVIDHDPETQENIRQNVYLY